MQFGCLVSKAEEGRIRKSVELGKMIIYMRKKCLYLISKTNINTTGTTCLNTQHMTRPRRERAGDAGVGRTSLNRSEDVQRRATQPVYFPLLFLGGPPWVRALSLQSDLGPPSASGLEVGRGRRTLPWAAAGGSGQVQAGSPLGSLSLHGLVRGTA